MTTALCTLRRCCRIVRPTRHPIALAALLAASAAPLAAHAITYTWTGLATNSNSWDATANWQNGTAPPANGLDTADLVFGVSSRVFPTVPGARSIRSLTFNNNASLYTFDGGPLTLGAGGITHNAANPQGFSTAAVALGANQTWTLASGAGSLSFGSGVSTSSGSTAFALAINVAATTGSGNIINGVISGSGSLAKNGSGVLTLTGASTYTGGTVVNAGTLAVASGARVGGADVQVNAGAGLAISGTVGNGARTILTVGGGNAAGAANVSLTGSTSVLSTGYAFIGSTSNGTVDHSGGRFTTGGADLTIGFKAGVSGIYNLSGSASSVSTSSTRIGDEGSGTVNQTGGSFTTGSNTLHIAYNGGSSGTYNLSGIDSRVSTGATWVGYSGSGTVNQSGGSFTTNGSTLQIAYASGSSGTYNLSDSGSSLSTGAVTVGVLGRGAFNQSGGSFTTNGSLLAVGAGIYNLSGGSLTTGITTVQSGASVFTQSGGTHTTGQLSLTGLAGSNHGTYNLNGGTLIAGRVSGASLTFGIGAFNFNGGTLQASTTNNSFLQSLATANVRAGGASIDTAGFNIAITQALLHDTAEGAAAIDGGLTKLGAGTLTLTGDNTFNGAVNIAAGTLAVAQESSLGSRSVITVEGGGSLLFTGNPTLARVYNLGAATLSIGNGNTLTLGSGAAVNGGFINGPGTTVLGSGSTLSGVTAFAGSTLVQTSGGAAVNGTTIRGALTQTGGTLAANNVFVTSSGRLSVGGMVNTTGTEVFGVTTIVSGGTLANSGSALYLSGGSRTTVNSGGTLSTAAGTTIELNGSQLVNNGRQSGVLDINFGSLAKGSGSFGTINVADGGKFSPGNSPGTATVENITFGAGGRYDFELNTANPRFGIDSDLLIVTDTLFITAGTTPASVFTLAIDSLNQANQPAPLSDFDSSRAYHFLVVDANNVSGYANARFNVDTSGFLNNLNGGRFSVSLSGNDLYLDFTPMPVPEPATWAMWLAAAAMGAGLQARRRRRSGG